MASTPPGRSALTEMPVSMSAQGWGYNFTTQPKKKEGKKRVKKEIREKRDNKMGVETENMFIDKKSKEKGNKKNPYKKM